MYKHFFLVLIVSQFIGTFVWGLNPSDFAYQKKITGPSTSIKTISVALDLDILKHTNREFTNIVLIDSTRTVIPFHIERDNENVIYLPVSDWKEERDVTYNIMKLYFDRPEIETQDFRVEFDGTIDKQVITTRGYYVPKEGKIVSKTVISKKPLENILDIPFYFPAYFPHYSITIEPISTFTPTKITSAHTLYKLLFKQNQRGPYYLYFGSTKTYIKKRIHDTDISLDPSSKRKEWTLGESKDNPSYRDPESVRLLWKNIRFWLVVLPLPLLIGLIYLIQLIKKK